MIIGSAFGFCQLILNSQSSGSQVLGPPEDKSVYNSSQELSLWYRAVQNSFVPQKSDGSTQLLNNWLKH